MQPLHRAGVGEREAMISALASALESEPHVVFAYLHGSFLNQPAFHDVDVAVRFAGDASAASRAAIALSRKLIDAVDPVAPAPGSSVATRGRRSFPRIRGLHVVYW